MTELAKLGIDAAYTLARGERARCVALLPPGGPSTPAGRRDVDSVSFPSIVWAAMSIYLRPVEQRAVMWTHDPS